MKKHIDVFDYSGDICKAMQKGILLTTKAGDSVNTMTIGWGFIGIEWGKPIFVALVRESRHTKSMLDRNSDFTVNIPVGELDSKIVAYCGTKSGRNTAKIQDLGLHLEDPEVINVPGIEELPLTLECKLLYKQAQDLSAIPEDILQHYYPQDVDGSAPGKNRDYHIAYYAQIVSSYIIED